MFTQFHPSAVQRKMTENGVFFLLYLKDWLTPKMQK